MMGINIKRFVLAILVLVSFDSFSQNSNHGFINDYDFINYLIKEKNYEESIALLGIYEKEVEPSLIDSLYFLKAWSYYWSKNLDLSVDNFSKISTHSTFYEQSYFFKNFCLMYLEDFDIAKQSLNSFLPSDSLGKALKNYQIAANLLLLKEYDSFENFSSKFTFQYYPFSEEEKKLIGYYNELIGYNEKSMWTAGLLSSIVPGLGKVYYGKTGEGISAFITNVTLGLVFYENLKKDGITDYKTIIFGTLFTTFYVGNIWGTVIGLKIRNDEFYEFKQQQILLDLHIPLRTIYN